jgi:LruC domain-containing protein
MKKLNLKLFFVVFTILSFSSCLDEKISDLNNASTTLGFDFKTTKEFNVSLTTQNNENQTIGGVYVKLYSQNPLTESGLLKDDSENFLVFKGLTDSNGNIATKIALPTFVDSLSVLINHIGLPNYQIVKLNGGNINVIVGGSSVQKTKTNVSRSKAPNSGMWWISDFWKVNDFYAFSNWNSLGVPNNLEATNDVISNQLLADVNATLPERIKLTVSHPEYLTSQDDGSIVLIEDAEVWVTFVHEGAGFSNTLAYYTHTNDMPPATKADIKYSTISFPNVSFLNSGGGLKSGNKVQLLYYDQAKAQYTNVFPAGTTVAWMFRANGWDSGSATVKNGLYNFYSDKRFNPEADLTLKKHSVILKDDDRKLLLIGFEDLRRDQSSDEDFNDGVFYATVTPYTAVKNGIYKKIDTPNDTDKDGVSDVIDEYPTDPTRAYNNYYPAKGLTGTLAFEDLWPSKGDYDFNDMIVDYNFNQITNGANKIVAINSELTLRAKGAHYSNGFGIEFNTTPENVKSITGQKITNGYLSVNSNGTEKNQSKAVVIAFDNAYDLLPSFNTINGQSYSTPKTIKINIEFTTPIDPVALGTAPYNPFIIIDKTRGKEVHLPTLAPTSLANLNLFGTSDDNSNIALGKYYMSDKYLPWAINIPVTFDYPAEKEDITKAFLNFNKWVETKGISNTDWYINKAGYRDNSKIFSK